MGDQARPPIHKPNHIEADGSKTPTLYRHTHTHTHIQLT